MSTNDFLSHVMRALSWIDNGSGPAILIYDECNIIKYISKRVEYWTGFTSAEVAGEHIGFLLSKDVERKSIAYLDQHPVKPINLYLRTKYSPPLIRYFQLSCQQDGCDLLNIAHLSELTEDLPSQRQTFLMQSAINNVDRPVIILDKERKIVFANHAFSHEFGYEDSETTGKEVSTLLASNHMEVDEYENYAHKTWGMTKICFEPLLRHKNGQDSRFNVTSHPIHNSGELELDGYSIDVFNHITRERQLHQLERDVLHALTSGLSFHGFGDYLCTRVGLILPDVTSSILLLDAEKKLRSWAVGELPSDFSRMVDGLAAGENVGSCGTAAWRGEPVLCNDIQTDPLWSDLKHFALEHNIHSCWSYPIIRRNGSVAGTFAFYATKSELLQTLPENIIATCASLCSLAIEREETQKRMEQLEKFDSLTGLPNRLCLKEYLKNQLESFPTRFITILSIGLRRFKEINEMQGHNVGDYILTILAHRFQHEFTPPGFVSRAGGDVFVIIIPGCTHKDIIGIAEHLTLLVTRTIEVNNYLITPSASIGICYTNATKEEQSVEMLLSNAEKAMFQAKESNTSYLFFDPDINDKIMERLLMGIELKSALASNLLTLNYQPQVNACDESVYGLEALCRWFSPKLGHVSPDRFIPLAEDLGLIDSLGRWTISEVCRQVSQWTRQGICVPGVSINLSPVNFQLSGLPEFITSQLTKYNIPGSILTIEVTERSVMTLTPEMKLQIEAIKKLGISLSIDDFGTGYSNLANLSNLPVDEIKIDRSFTMNSHKERTLSLIEAIIKIGSSLSLRVVAEGVETLEQKELLNNYKCPILQGYYFSKPLNAIDTTKYLQSIQDKQKESN